MNWISLKEQKPPEGDRYLVLLEHDNHGKLFNSVDIARFCCYQNWILKKELLGGPISSRVIAWQHLPEPPVQNKNHSKECRFYASFGVLDDFTDCSCKDNK